MKITLFLIMVFFSASLLAESKEPTTIIITNSRGIETTESRAASITVIDQVEILRSGASEITEVLRNQAGISITEGFGSGQGTVDMRGFGESATSNTLILVDGRRLNNADISAPALNSIALSNIERIEIIKGSAGSLYGDQAVGGVINIITRGIDDFAANLKVEAGSYDKRRFVGRYADRFADHFSLRLHFDTFETDNYRDNNEQESEHLFSRFAFDNKKLSAFIEFQQDKDEQQQPGALLSDEAEADPRQSIADFQNDFSDVEETVWRQGFKYQITPYYEFVTEYAERDQETVFLNNFRGCIAGDFCSAAPNNEERETQSFTPRLLAKLPLNESHLFLTLGADFEETDYKITFNDRQNEQKVNSYYFNSVIPLAKSIDVTLGGRYSEVSNKINDSFSFPSGTKVDDSSTVYTIGAAKKIDNIRFFVRYDENFRFAKVDELAFAENNEPLDNQEGVSKEIGFDLNVKRVRFSTTFYQIDIEDEIAFDPAATPPPGSFFLGANVNFDSTERKGVNIELEMDLTSRSELAFSIVRQKSEFRSGTFKGNTVSGVPDTLARAALQYRLLNNWYGQLETNYVGEQFLSGDNSNAQDKKKSYTVTNLSSRYETGNWAFNLRINNLFDKHYSQVENAFGATSPSPERNFQISAAYQL